jgi:polyhydroxybutyrate depolymerase
MNGGVMFTGIACNFSRAIKLVAVIVLDVILMLACNITSSPTETSTPIIETPSPTTEASPPATETSPPPNETSEGEVLSPGDSNRSLVFEGVERSYILHIPPGFNAFQPVPLVLAFHGIGLDGNEMIRISGFNAQSDISGFVVVYPDGTGDKKSWNGGHCCGEAALHNADDVGFVRALLEELSTLVNLDPKRVYATGFSNGAIMVYRLACELSDQIAAIGPISATQALEDLSTCQPARPIPVIHFHGTDDEPNPYNGGETAAGAHFISVADAMRFWTKQDGCPAQPQQTESGSILHDIYAPCQSGATVELYTIEGGKHAWPGGEAVNQLMGEPTMEIFATPIMWEFFLSHPMP